MVKTILHRAVRPVWISYELSPVTAYFVSELCDQWFRRLTSLSRDSVQSDRIRRTASRTDERTDR